RPARRGVLDQLAVDREPAVPDLLAPTGNGGEPERYPRQPPRPGIPTADRLTRGLGDVVQLGWFEGVLFPDRRVAGMRVRAGGVAVDRPGTGKDDPVNVPVDSGPGRG